MTQRTPRERCLPTQGGFETRPYESPDLFAGSSAAGSVASTCAEMTVDLHADLRGPVLSK